MHSQISLIAVLLLLMLTAKSAVAAEVRTWTSAGGEHTLEASLDEVVTLDNGDVEVVLLKLDGKPIRMPLVKLSEADQKHLGKWNGPDTPPPVEQNASEPKGTDRAAKPVAEPSVDEDWFRPGQGPEKARLYLKEQLLLPKNDLWYFSNETSFREQLEDAEQAFAKFRKLNTKYQSMKKKLPQYERLRKALDAKWNELVRSRADTGRTATEMAEDKAMREQVSAKLKAIADFQSRARKYKGSVSGARSTLSVNLSVVETYWERVQRRYQVTAEKEAVKAALTELGAELRPIDRLKKHRRKLEKIRAAFDKVEL